MYMLQRNLMQSNGIFISILIVHQITITSDITQDIGNVSNTDLTRKLSSVSEYYIRPVYTTLKKVNSFDVRSLQFTPGLSGSVYSFMDVIGPSIYLHTYSNGIILSLTTPNSVLNSCILGRFS